MKYSLLFIVLICLVFIPLSSASLGTFKVLDCVPIVTVLNTSAVNLTILTSPAPTPIILLQNQPMQKVGNSFNYTYCTQTNSTVGTYNYGYIDAEGNVYSNDFDLSATGSPLSGAKAALYFMVFFISFFLFAICLVFGFFLPYKNNTDAMTGYIIAVSNTKYAKIFSFAIAYLMLMLMAYFGWIISYSYLNLDFLTNLLRFSFNVLVGLVFPGFIVGVYLVIANWVKDSKISDYLSQGLRVSGNE